MDGEVEGVEGGVDGEVTLVPHNCVSETMKQFISLVGEVHLCKVF